MALRRSGGDRAQRERALGLVFWLSAGWIGMLVVIALLLPVLPIRDPDELGIRTREIARYEGPGWNAWFGGDEQGRDSPRRAGHPDPSAW